MKFVKVAVARPIRKTFTYKNLVPNENIVGKRVFIEFHRKKVVGVVETGLFINMANSVIIGNNDGSFKLIEHKG